MNVLDENILESQRLLLRSWRIHVRQIGVDFGVKGMKDPDVLPFLLTLPKPTFFTRDLGFFRQEFCHPKRSLVILAVGAMDAAFFVRAVLRSGRLNTHQKRMGLVVRAMPTGLVILRPHAPPEEVEWESTRT